MSLAAPLLSIYKEGFGIKKPPKGDVPLNK